MTKTNVKLDFSKIEIDRDVMRTDSGSFRTQSLFLDLNYSDIAIFTFADEHREYEGRPIYSLKKLFLDMEDPTEYLFANKYLLGWKHWKRFEKNKDIKRHIDEWRYELELKLTAQGIQHLLDIASDDKSSYQAAKWLADKGWSDSKRGRPSKDEVNAKIEEAVKEKEEDAPDIILLSKFKEG